MSSKGKKKQQLDTVDDELDQLLEDLDLKPTVSEKELDIPEKVETKSLNEATETSATDTVSKSKKKKDKKKEKKKEKADDDEVDKPKGKKVSAAARAAAERLKLVQELEELQRQEEEAERRRIAEEEERIRLEEEAIEREKQLRKQQRQERKERLKQQGKLLTSKERENLARNKIFLEQLKAKGIAPPLEVNTGDSGKRPLIDSRKRRPKQANNSKLKEQTSDNEIKEPEELDNVPESESESTLSSSSLNDDWEKISLESDEDSDTPTKPHIKQPIKPTPKPATEPTKDELPYRSPVCCVLGHVDTGKTKLLDKIRHTNVQRNEAGGITQQIGATFFPRDALEVHSKLVNPNFNLQIPGLLIIDTPGHESFNNLRARGSSLCDIAILVVDVMHGLEPQTLESIGLLKNRNCPFIIAMNKVDRVYGWKPQPWKPILETLSQQKESSKDELDDRIRRIQSELSGQGLNCKLYWENDDYRRNISICPISAVSGEGVPDLLFLIMKLVQMFMSRMIKVSDEFSCHLMEVKNIEGLGVTIDVILFSGELKVGDLIVICGMNGPIVTTIRAILTPQPLKESRIKGEYARHNSIKGTIGVKIVSQGLEDAVAGTELILAQEGDDIEELKDEVMRDMKSIFDCVDRSGVGVYLMASTLGSLEALLQFINTQNIPVFGVNIGTVQKKDVKKASVMLEKKPEYAVILAFDVKVTTDAEKEAESLGVTIFCADIIYHLFDMLTKHMEDKREAYRKQRIHQAIFPCELSIIPRYIFNKKDPLIFGVKVENGLLKVGTPIVVPDKDNLMIGSIGSLEVNNKPTDKAVKGQEVCIKICGEPNIMYGRHFDASNKLYSKITRDSIDCLKEFFRDEVPKDGWQLIVHLKKIFNIV